MQTEIAKDEMTRVPLSLIIKGDNPRKHFDAAEHEELTASVAAKGVIQPVILRPVEGGMYKIVAGERRYRAAVEAYGIDGYDIPAVIKEIGEEEAAELALIENIQRADMSVSEEAVSAGNILDRYKGDRNEAAAALGWALSKFNRRIALLNLIPEAMDALNERRILTGHAELLCVVPQDKQGKALQTIIDHCLTVSQVKELLVKVSTKFSEAIFPLDSCAQCHHNSSQQATLFVEAISEGSCTNKVCFEGKTAEKIEAIRAELAEEVQTVRVLQIGENGFSRLSADGNLGVGQEQYDECRACGKFGATVSNLPNDRGTVERSICFDTDCAQRMAADRIKAERVAAQPVPKATPATAPDASETLKEAATGTKAATKAPKAAKAKVYELSQRVVEYRRKNVWESAVKKELAANPAKSRAFVFDLMLTGDTTLINRENLTKIFVKISGESYPDTDRYSDKKVGHPELAYALTAEQQEKMFSAAAISAVSSEAFKDSRMQKLLTFLDTDLTRHYSLDAGLLNLLTKSEIEAVCVNLGLDALITDYKKLIGGKKDEAIKAILAAPFQFDGAVPSILNY